MAKVNMQSWKITLEDGSEHLLSCAHRPLARHMTMTIDGEAFEIPTGEREEIFRLGDEQMLLCVDRSSHVRIQSPRGEEPESEATEA